MDKPEEFFNKLENIIITYLAAPNALALFLFFIISPFYDIRQIAVYWFAVTLALPLVFIFMVGLIIIIYRNIF